MCTPNTSIVGEFREAEAEEEGDKLANNSNERVHRGNKQKLMMMSSFGLKGANTSPDFGINESSVFGGKHTHTYVDLLRGAEFFSLLNESRKTQERKLNTSPSFKGM